eukprot:4225435-Amphidinium_carterae.1
MPNVFGTPCVFAVATIARLLGVFRSFKHKGTKITGSFGKPPLTIALEPSCFSSTAEMLLPLTSKWFRLTCYITETHVVDVRKTIYLSAVLFEL